MTAQELMELAEIDEAVFARCAKLTGLEGMDSYDDDQEVLIELAAHLDRLRFREEHIRLCCEDLSRFPEVVLRELETGDDDKKRKAQLRSLLEYLEDGWDGDIADAQMAVLWMDCHEDWATGEIFGPVSLWPMILCMIAAIAAAFALMPVLRETAQGLLEVLFG